MSNDFEAVLKQALLDTKVQLTIDSKVLATYMAERTLVLATIAGQVGYERAVIAERDNVLLYAGMLGVDQADGAQMRLIGIIQGALGLGAQVLARA